MPLRHCLAQGISQLSGKPLPVSDHPLGKEIFLNVQSEPPSVQLCAVTLSSIIRYQRFDNLLSHLRLGVTTHI